MNQEVANILFNIIVIAGFCYIGVMILAVFAANGKDIWYGILKRIFGGINIEDMQMERAIYKHDEANPPDKYHKTIKMPYKEFYKLWQSQKLNLIFDTYSVNTVYEANNNDKLEYKHYTVFCTIYFSTFDTLFRYIPLRKSVYRFKRNTKSKILTNNEKRKLNREQTRKEIHTYIESKK